MTGRSNPHAGPLARILKNVGWLLAGKGVGAVLSLVYLGLATRMLHPIGFGQFALVLSVAQAVVALVSFQTWQIIIRYGATHRAEGRTDALARLTSFCLLLDAGGAVVGCGIAAALVLWLDAPLGLPAALRWPALGFCTAMLLSVRSTAVGLLRLHDRFGAGALADSSTSFARLLGTLVAVCLGASVRGLLIAWAVAEIATAASYWLLVWQHAPLRIKPLRRGDLAGIAAENPGLRAFAGVTNVGATLASVSKQVPVLVVGGMLGPAAAGAYRLAYQLAQALARASDMFARAAFAELSQVHAGGRRSELQRLARQTGRLALGAGIILAAVLLLAGRPILRAVAGRGYDGAYPLLLILGLAASLDVVAVTFEPLLMATGEAGRALQIRLVTAAVLLIALMSGAALGGASGAAGAMLLSSVMSLLLLGRAARRIARGRLPPFVRSG